MSSRQILAANLDRIMKERKLTQVDISKRSRNKGGSISQSHVSAMQNQAKAPTIDTLDDLADALGLTADALISVGGVFEDELFSEVQRKWSDLSPEGKAEVLRTIERELRFANIAR